MPTTTRNLYSTLGPLTRRNIFGYRKFDAMVARVTLTGNQTSNPVMDPSSTPNAKLLLAGTPVAILTATGKAVLAKTGGTDGSQIVYGVLAWDYDTSSGDVTAAIYVTGNFRRSAIPLQGTDTIATLFAACPKYKVSLFIEDDIPAPPVTL
jgi:hypothetical protein